jgi:muramoyltetrapeptide carboxypeptidase
MFGEKSDKDLKHIIPPALNRGDQVAIVATARWISEEHLDIATKLLESWGFQVKPGKYLHTRHYQLAGTDIQRAADLQAAMNDPDIKAIIIARGGYGTVKILDMVDFTPLLRSPKWICGYSDITALHMKLRTMGIASIHSTMPVSFSDATSDALQNLRLALQGELREVEFSEGIKKRTLNSGISGDLVGGNLSVLFSMLGSPEMTMRSDFVLFIEDVDEMLYHIDRMMTGLKRSGFFDRLKGFCLGGFTQMKDNTAEFGFNMENPWGFNAFQTISGVADELGSPVFSGFPAGHMLDNRAFYLGIPMRLESRNGLNRMIFQQPDWEK